MTAKKKKRNPFLAGLLSLLFTGLGQVYNGKAGLGITFFFISGALFLLWGVSGWPHHFIGLVAYAIVDIVLWLFIAVHAFIQARRMSRRTAFSPTVRTNRRKNTPTGKWLPVR